jgi:hypothetical protein
MISAFIISEIISVVGVVTSLIPGNGKMTEDLIDFNPVAHRRIYCA